MKKPLATLSLCLLVLLCPGPKAWGEDGAAYRGLTVAWWGDHALTQALEGAIAQYEKENPTLFMDHTAIEGYEPYREALLQAAAQGALPDVMLLTPELLRLLAAQGEGAGFFADLETTLDALDLTQYSYLGLEGGAIDGQLCAVPTSMTGHLLMWNGTALKALGWEAPDSSAALMSLGHALQGSEAYPLAADSTGRMALVAVYLQSRYGHPWVNRSTLACGFTQAQLMDGLQYLQGLEQAGVLPPLSQQGDIIQGWQQGKYLGVWGWAHTASQLNSTLQVPSHQLEYAASLMDWGPYPGGFHKAQYYVALSATSNNPQQAAGLVQFLLGSDQGIQQLGSRLGIPDNQAAYTYASRNRLLDSVNAAAGKAALAWGLYPMPLGFEAQGFTGPDGVYQQVLTGLETGVLTLEAAALALMSGIEAVLQ